MPWNNIYQLKKFIVSRFLFQFGGNIYLLIENCSIVTS